MGQESRLTDPSPRHPVADLRALGSGVAVDSTHYEWHRRPGLFLAIRYLRRNAVPVRETPLEELPHLSRSMIRLAVRLSSRFLDRADVTFPIIVAGRGWYQIALDGRHRISRAIWFGLPNLWTTRVPWWYSLEILTPGVFEAEWLYLFARRELRRAGRRLRSHPNEARPETEGIRIG